MPDVGRVVLCFQSTVADVNVQFRALKIAGAGVCGEVYCSPVVAPGGPICVAPGTMPAGKFVIVVESSADGAKLAESKPRVLFSRNSYTYSFDGKSVDVAGKPERFASQKRALASEFLDLPQVRQFLESPGSKKPKGVLFAPSNSAMRRLSAADLRVDDYFVSGNPNELLSRRVTNDETGASELMLKSDSNRSTFTRNEEGSSIWSCAQFKNVAVLGSAALTDGPDSESIALVVIDATAQELRMPGGSL